MDLEVFSPAKINLFLAVTGRRTDGFHDLVSVAVPLAFGDRLRVELAENGDFSLECNAPGVPRDDSNLVLRAARLFREATGWSGGARFVLTKHTPVGAGLGGGSSNATAALVALNQLAGEKPGLPELAALAAQIGSDCALFLHDSPVVMRGRGERIQVLPEAVARRLLGQRILLFQPSFGIGTAWAYAQMAAATPALYLPEADAEARLSSWIARGDAGLPDLLFNNMEPVAFAKFTALPVLLERLRTRFGLAVGMSGSGSACFALLDNDAPVAAIRSCIHEAWGEHVFVTETKTGRSHR